MSKATTVNPMIAENHSVISAAMMAGYPVVENKGGTPVFNRAAIKDATIAGHFNSALCATLLDHSAQDKRTLASEKKTANQEALREESNKAGLGDILKSQNNSDGSCRIVVGDSELELTSGQVKIAASLLAMFRLASDVRDEEEPPSLSLVSEG